ncbi:outer membrane protein assembly factor BamD [Chryseobacterium sp. PTM-20240506]|uniref:outer membrane protein assembly factor BamD n=1 Tax=unclassified Chryseobacterium TaxID=2593645 RepID=UPI00155176EB|nr:MULTISPECIES: outer membrane protein assembly factor BamD [unclassified Chryseobacterium]MDC8105838.1 outer membrane protein assembly factor BamD [Chryseobacterium sp. B21-037]MDQ1804341.1 outer membrane protein assembly factor BamD [Chryseobacterium sp. CKR4-1]WBV55049.1 outer membrane protein assembly factor BamD [Chryseobacterium daecheongense]
MKKYILGLFAIAVISSCASQQEKALKSADKAFILKAANENFAKKKWKNALALYDRLANLVAGTDDFPNVGFNTAYANYYDKNYKLAGHQFKNFAVSFPKDPRAEEAAYMSALCYYEGSMDYNLDQSSTELAVNELQDFLNNYPNSERSKNINQLIDELTYKLEFKSYENARQYYKMGDYKSATVALENVLEDFPSTKLRPKIYDYMMKSRYLLAQNSVYGLKEERIESAIAFTRQVEKELPNTEYSKTAVDLREKLDKEKQNFAVVKKQTEARLATLTARQKKEAEKLEARTKTDQQIKDQVATEKKALQIQRDSAALQTPPPAATFKIKR